VKIGIFVGSEESIRAEEHHCYEDKGKKDPASDIQGLGHAAGFSGLVSSALAGVFGTAGFPMMARHAARPTKKQTIRATRELMAREGAAFIIK